MDADGFRVYLLSNNLSDYTVRTYVSFIEAYEGDFSLDGVRSFIAKKLETISSAGVNKYIKAFKRYCDYQDIAWGAKLKKLTEKVPKYQMLDAEEIRQLIDIRDNKYSVYFEVLAYSGARPNEVAQLTHECLYDGFLLFKDTKTGEDREVAIPSSVYYSLKEYARGVQGQYLFTGYKDKPLTNAAINKEFKIRLELLGIHKKTRVHDLRHAWATTNSRENNIRVIQEQLGHKSLQTTQRYLHPTRGDLRRVVESDPRLLSELQKNELFEKAVDEVGQLQKKYKDRLVVRVEESSGEIKLRIRIDD